MNNSAERRSSYADGGANNFHRYDGRDGGSTGSPEQRVPPEEMIFPAIILTQPNHSAYDRDYFAVP
ncbi:MAG: hypothetical protein ACSHX8_05005 [Opitutaceae bacterium]